MSLNNYIPGEARGDGAQYLCVGTVVSIDSQYHVSQSLPLEISKSIESLFLHLEVSPNIQSPRHPNYSSVKVYKVPVIAAKYQSKYPEALSLPLEFN